MEVEKNLVEEPKKKARQKRQTENMDVARPFNRVYNYESPTRSVDDDVPLYSAVEAVGSKVMNPRTGEILMERPNYFYAIDRLGSATFTEEVGDPLIVDFTRNRDLKARALALVGSSNVAGLFNDDAIEDDDDTLMDQLEKLPSSEVLDFNHAMAQSPYSVDENGLAKYERDLASSKQELEQLRQYMSVKDHPLLERLKDRDMDQILEFLNSYDAQQIDKPSEES